MDEISASRGDDLISHETSTITKHVKIPRSSANRARD
jgi:hypothetical protein